MEKKKFRFLKQSLMIFIIVTMTVVFSGCNSESTSPIDQPVVTNTQTPEKTAKELTNQFAALQEASEKFLKNTKLEAMTAQEVYQKVIIEGDQSYFVVDVRAQGDFAKGAIEGSVNIPYASAADPKQIANLPKDKKIIVVCYSGHTANQTAALWSMLGYDVVPMLNGMGGWNSTPGLGTPLLKEVFEYPVVTAEPQTATFELPKIDEKKVFNLNDLIVKRSQAYLASGKGPVIKPEDVMNDITNKTNNFFLLDMRKPEDYKKGHIEGAINIPYQDVATTENLKRIPTNQKIIVVGYTGNDASQVVRVLNQLGYDTYAMLRGMRVWTSNEEINGIAPMSTEKVAEFPAKPINVELNSTGGSASCG